MAERGKGGRRETLMRAHKDRKKGLKLKKNEMKLDALGKGEGT